MPVTRRTLTLALAASALAPAALAAAAPLSPADKALVDRAVAYLQGLDEAKARFTQTDGSGRETAGTVWLKRPGKARFEYDPPSGLVVVSDGAAVTVADNRLRTFTRYPLGATPLSLFLARTIRLDRGVAVTAVDRNPDGFTIVARDGRGKTAGRLALDFAEPPLRLTGWTVIDAQGRTTRVRLQGLARVSGLDAALFVPKKPIPSERPL